jgi:hypothetical protein
MEAGYCRGPGPSRAVAPQMIMMMMSLNNFNCLVFVMETQCVECELGTESLCCILCRRTSGFKVLESFIRRVCV